MTSAKNITEATTLAELREQLLLAEVIALRLYPPFDSEEPRAASLHHKTGFYVGCGPTEAVAIEAAFVRLRRIALLSEPLPVTRKTTAQLDRDIAKALKKPVMTVKRADEVIRAANLEGFSGRCGRVAIAINRVVFGDKGRYVVATNQAISEHNGQMFMGHVMVEWKRRLFDATGLIDNEDAVTAWGQADHTDPDLDYLTEDEALDGYLGYVDELFKSRAAQERAIEAGTQGQCPLRDVERALREAMAS